MQLNLHTSCYCVDLLCVNYTSQSLTLNVKVNFLSNLARIRRDPAAFERYQHNRDLVALLNVFAVTDRDLPPGWESKLDRNGKVNTKLLWFDHVVQSIHLILYQFISR